MKTTPLSVSLILLLLLLRAVTTPLQAQLTWVTNSNGTITITDGCPSSPGAVTIPDTIDGLPVTSIGGAAFGGCTSLTSITIPNSVTSIEWDAFTDCSNLTSVTIGSSVTNISITVFSRCSSLTAIVVDHANPSYSSLDGVLFNKNQTTLIRYPVGKAGAYTIPNSVTSIPRGTFIGCTGLTSITIPESVTGIESEVFAGCTSLTNVVIGEGVIVIGQEAFSMCTSLTSIVIPDGVTSIGNAAFSDCASLSHIVFPARLTDWGGRFARCTNLVSAYFEGDAPPPDSVGFDDSPLLTVYYMSGTQGWGPTFSGRPTAFWVRPQPALLNVRRQPPLWIISWATNATVVVDASPTLTNPIWSPVSTHTLTNGTAYFSDLEWASYPSRFYRVRQQ